MKTAYHSKFVLATIHRLENINSKNNISQIFQNLDKINDHTPVILPLHPHTKQKIIDFNINSRIQIINPQSYLEMLGLLSSCSLVITDSGGLQKESYFANKKCIVVRDQTEWVELLSEGSITLCKPSSLLNVFEKVVDNESIIKKNIYGDGKACDVIIRSIIKYLS